MSLYWSCDSIFFPLCGQVTCDANLKNRRLKVQLANQLKIGDQNITFQAILPIILRLDSIENILILYAYHI